MTSSPCRFAPALWAMLALLTTVAPAAFAGPAVDAVGEHLAAGAADGGLPSKERRACVRAAKPFVRADLPGATDDFKKLVAAAREARGPLRGDTTLATLLDAALVEARATLDSDAAALVQVLVLIDPGRARTVVERASSTATRLRLKFVAAVAEESAKAADAGLRAASSYASAAKLAAKTLGRQDRRPARWTVAVEGLGGALLSVWTDGAVVPSTYTVGASDTTTAGGSGPLFLRLSGDAWVRVPVLPSGDLWWVTGVPGDGVWACGSGGQLVRYDPQTGDVAERSVPGVTAILYGVWGAAADDVWTVGGGEAIGGGTAPELHHWNGLAWTPVAVPPAAANRILYKVWGSAADDVWACGSGGVILHYDGAKWTSVASDTVNTLLTIQGSPGGGNPVVAVGAPGTDATITERGVSGAWKRVALSAGLESLNGVAIDANGDGYAAGVFGQVLRRSGGAWTKVTGVPTPGSLDHHAVTIDARGGAWFVGGSLTGALDGGFLLHFGPRTVPSQVLARATLRGDVAPALNAACATIGCHLAPFANENLDFATAESTRGGTFGVASTQSPIPRVLAGRPSQSYLWHKLVGTHLSVGGSGDRMPNTGTGLPQRQLDFVYAWIAEGALDD
ncbi:MAG: hypothetical protein K8T90_19805 [Planctomycetes bacterium]|nr:hypothetical protein [Planctomycetota bacterium]